MGTPYQKASFLLGAAELNDLPADEGIEIAFAGRSNAGKSSALNGLTGQKSLARVSKQPGRTQQINFFELSATERLVDLPGYGFAQVSKKVKAKWQQVLHQYLISRESLRGLVLLMDCRHPLQPMDQSLLHWAQEAELPLHILLTKADKLSRGSGAGQVKVVERYIKEHDLAATVQLFSALKKTGVQGLGTKLDEWFGGAPEGKKVQVAIGE